MWDDLRVQIGSGQPMLVIRTNEQVSRVNQQLMDCGKELDPPRLLLHYTPISGLGLLDPETGVWKTVLSPEKKLGEVSRYLLNTMNKPFILHLEQSQLWWNGNTLILLRQLAALFRDQLKTVVCTIPMGAEIPDSLLPYATTLTHPTPDRTEMEDLVYAFLDESRWVADCADPSALIDNVPLVATSLRGLTEGYAEAALTYAFHKAEDLEPAQFTNGMLWEFVLREIFRWKSSQAIAGRRIAQMDTSDLHEVAGWEFFRQEIMRLKRAGAFTIGNPLFPGMQVFLGLPGCGKSYVALLIGKWTGLPVYDTQTAAMMGSGVVSSLETAFAATFADAKMVGPCVLRIDELEKLIGGAQSSNRSDSGAMNRGTQILLKFAQEEARQNGVMIVATMNSTDVRPEDIRMGRSFGTYFVDLPDPKTRAEATRILLDDWVTKMNAWNKVQGHSQVTIDDDVTPAYVASVTEGWVPAEIEVLLQKALINGAGKRISRQGIKLAIDGIVPMTKLMPDKIAQLRELGRHIPSVGAGLKGSRTRRQRRVPTTGAIAPNTTAVVKTRMTKVPQIQTVTED